MKRGKINKKDNKIYVIVKMPNRNKGKIKIKELWIDHLPKQKTKIPRLLKCHRTTSLTSTLIRFSKANFWHAFQFKEPKICNMTFETISNAKDTYHNYCNSTIESLGYA